MAHPQSAARQRFEPRDDDVLSRSTAHKNELPTPLYLYSASHLNDAVASYRMLFPQGARGFYSLKANPQPSLVQHMASLGIGVEVVSRGEWRLAALAGEEKA